jgi:hypothetical protein
VIEFQAVARIDTRKSSSRSATEESCRTCCGSWSARNSGDQKYHTTPAPVRVPSVDDVEVPTIELEAPGTSEVMLGRGDVTVRLNPSRARRRH